ncbi:F-box/LRR-repeat protein 4 [Chrysoperla carnea]|uniref:F-box/LRR-repeat protein 4 n=1 Tax=Chrysoperla carnea TaxID=189513 RepID=UPI001D087122|nr:F-box/LRR-repeat protein 4 [Chrysoperla carnea]
MENEEVINAEEKLSNTKNDVNFKFIEQYVCEVIDFSSQYGSDISISYTACNIVGKPLKFPNYGDFPQTFVMRTYGTWWNQAPSREIEYMPRNDDHIIADDYIDLLFECAVYPWQIYIFETYNPGAVVRIWCNVRNKSWILLWESSPTHVPQVSRSFCPAIKTINYQTNLIRLEFNQRLLNYHTEIDAVMLVGSLEPIPSLHNDVPNNHLCKKIEEFGITAAIPGKLPTLKRHEIEELMLATEKMLTEQSRSPSSGSFFVLPDETIIRIFTYLDLLSLSRCALVNKRFYSLATDALLYTSVSFKSYWYRVDRTTLYAFSRRCAFLQKFDLSWCGDHDRITSFDFSQFLKTCGTTLTHLRLNCCKFVNNFCLKDIARFCSRLKELGLRNCTTASEVGFGSLAQLTNLERLDLYRAAIEGPALVSILRANPKMKHLSVGACGHIAAMDDVAFVLSRHNLDLISVDFWKSYSLSLPGLYALANCRKLQELDIGWCLGLGTPGECLLQVAKNCTEIRRLVLAALRGLTDSDLIPIFESCTKLEQIDLVGLQGITSVSCVSALVNCQNLRLLDISFCGQIHDDEVEIWRLQYPNACIKRSFQADMRDELAPVIQ